MQWHSELGEDIPGRYLASAVLPAVLLYLCSGHLANAILNCMYDASWWKLEAGSYFAQQYDTVWIVALVVLSYGFAWTACLFMLLL